MVGALQALAGAAAAAQPWWSSPMSGLVELAACPAGARCRLFYLFFIFYFSFFLLSF
jgi:hypothetical protein